VESDIDLRDLTKSRLLAGSSNMGLTDGLIILNNILYLASALAGDLRVLRLLAVCAAVVSIWFYSIAGFPTGIHLSWLAVLLRRYGLKTVRIETKGSA